MNKKTLALFFSLWLSASLIFWFWEGNTLKYDVYSESIYRYSEDFSTTGRVIISFLTGLFASTFFILMRWFLNDCIQKNRKQRKGDS